MSIECRHTWFETNRPSKAFLGFGCVLITVIGLVLLTVSVSAETFSVDGGGTVIDQAGRRISVEKPFERIISLYGAHTENLFALGSGRAVIGVSKNEVYPPEALEKQVFSYRDDPEKFLAVRPDLVLIRPMIGRGYPQLVRRLEKSGIRVVSLQPATVRDMFRYWEVLGALTGKHAKALEMADRFKSAVAVFQELTDPVDPKKQVYFEAIHNKMKTFTPRSMAIFALETAGGINIAADATQVRQTNIAYYGKERILAKAGQIDVYLAQKGAMNQPTLAMITSEPGFKAIKAVKTGQVFIIDEMIISRPTMRLLEGIYQIGKRLYPQIFNASVKEAI